MNRREQKQAVALLLMQQAGTLLEFWSEHNGTDGIDVEDAREWLATWLMKLPGTAWDTRLDHP